MTEKEAKQVLIAHNEWRRGGEGEMQDPKILGLAIDKAIESLPLPPVMPRCKTCINWKRDGDCGYGVCSKIEDEIDIELRTGWEGGYVEYIETNEDFGCTSHNEA